MEKTSKLNQREINKFKDDRAQALINDLVETIGYTKKDVELIERIKELKNDGATDDQIPYITEIPEAYYKRPW